MSLFASRRISSWNRSFSSRYCGSVSGVGSPNASMSSWHVRRVSSSASLVSRSAASRAAAPSSTPRTSIPSQTSSSVNLRTMKPPVGYGSSSPSCASRSSARRIGVRDAPSRPVSGASDTRSPGLNSPLRIISRSRSTVRAICELVSDVSVWMDTAVRSCSLTSSLSHLPHGLGHAGPRQSIRSRRRGVNAMRPIWNARLSKFGMPKYVLTVSQFSHLESRATNSAC